MKRFFCFLLCAILLSACGQVIPSEQPSTTLPDSGTPDTTAAIPPETTVPEETQPQILQLPMSAIYLPTVTETLYADDGTLLYTDTYQEVSLTMPDPESADHVILDLLSRIDNIREADSHLKTWAQEDYTGQDFWHNYATEVLYAPVRMDEKVLSLYGTAFNYAGGVHPNYVSISANYDLATGTYLKLEDVLVDKVAADKLCHMVQQSLEEIAEEYYLFDDYIRTVDERFGTIFDPTWESTDAWFLSSEGLGIYFSPYDIAPYAAGKIELVYPYAELEGILLPDYIPAALPELQPGVVNACLAQDVDLDRFTQFAEVPLDPDGEQVVLYSDGLVTELKLEIGSWDMEGTMFIPASTVFAASSLTPGDAIMLSTMFSDTMPHIRMTYTSAGEEYTYFLFQSGKDGSILILDE